DTLFHALVRYAAPVLVFTSEEVWNTRYPEGGSVHLLEWPDFSNLRHSRESGNPVDGGDESPLGPRLRGDDEFRLKWRDIRAARRLVTEAIEPFRRDKTIGSSLEAEVVLTIRDSQALEWCRSVDMAEICITASCHLASGSDDAVQAQRSTKHK